MNSSRLHFVVTQTNDANANEVVVYERGADGRLAVTATHATGGRGNGVPHLASQASVVVSSDARFLFVTNAGSNDVSVFGIGSDGLALAAAPPSTALLMSIAVHGDLVYVLTTGDNAGVAGFRLGSDGSLSALHGSERPLSAPGADPARVGFSPDGTTQVVVTERGAQRHRLVPGWPRAIRRGDVLPSSARRRTASPSRRRRDARRDRGVRAEVGAAAASWYRLDGRYPSRGSVATVAARSAGQSSPATAATPSRPTSPTAPSRATRSTGMAGLRWRTPSPATRRRRQRDFATRTSRDGRFLYAIDADPRQLFGWAVEDRRSARCRRRLGRPAGDRRRPRGELSMRLEPFYRATFTTPEAWNVERRERRHRGTELPDRRGAAPSGRLSAARPRTTRGTGRRRARARLPGRARDRRRRDGACSRGRGARARVPRGRGTRQRRREHHPPDRRSSLSAPLNQRRQCRRERRGIS